MEEKFRSIPGFPAYQVSNLGNIKSCYKRSKKSKYIVSNNFDRILKQCKDVDAGYPYVNICHDGKSYRFKVHKLVMLAFVGSPPIDKPVIRHIDNNKENNNLSNLCYGTHKDNADDKRKRDDYDKIKITYSKLNFEQVKEIKDRLSMGQSHKEIALDYPVGKQTISLISANKIWK